MEISDKLNERKIIDNSNLSKEDLKWYKLPGRYFKAIKQSELGDLEHIFKTGSVNGSNDSDLELTFSLISKKFDYIVTQYLLRTSNVAELAEGLDLEPAGLDDNSSTNTFETYKTISAEEQTKTITKINLMNEFINKYAENLLNSNKPVEQLDIEKSYAIREFSEYISTLKYIYFYPNYQLLINDFDVRKAKVDVRIGDKAFIPMDMDCSTRESNIIYTYAKNKNLNELRILPERYDLNPYLNEN